MWSLEKRVSSSGSRDRQRRKRAWKCIRPYLRVVKCCEKCEGVDILRVPQRATRVPSLCDAADGCSFHGNSFSDAFFLLHPSVSPPSENLLALSVVGYFGRNLPRHRERVSIALDGVVSHARTPAIDAPRAHFISGHSTRPSRSARPCTTEKKPPHALPSSRLPSRFCRPRCPLVGRPRRRRCEATRHSAGLVKLCCEREAQG